MQKGGGFNFIDEYVNLVYKLTDSPVPFLKATALFLLSTFTARRFRRMSRPEMNPWSDGYSGGQILNLWFILIGKSRITRKSTVVGYAEDLINALNDELLLPYDFTPQSLVTELSKKCDGTETRAVWLNDETSGFFEQLDRADFMTATDTLLSRIYDGRDYTRSTISRGEEPIRKPYLTVLLSSTEYLPTLFDVGRLRQGFLNRFIYVVGEKDRRLPSQQNIPQPLRNKATDLQRWLDALSNQTSDTFMDFTSDAQEIYNRYESKVEKVIQNSEMEEREGYFGNLPNFLVRLSCLHRIARVPIQKIEDYSKAFLTVEKKDVKWAKDYTRSVWNNFIKVVQIMKTSATSKPVKTSENALEMVYQAIIEGGKKLTRTELSNKVNMRADRLDKLINTLREQDRIEREVKGQHTQGHPKIIYKAKL